MRLAIIALLLVTSAALAGERAKPKDAGETTPVRKDDKKPEAPALSRRPDRSTQRTSAFEHRRAASRAPARAARGPQRTAMHERAAAAMQARAQRVKVHGKERHAQVSLSRQRVDALARRVTAMQRGRN